MIHAVDLFAGGARGWDIHDEDLGITSLGIESDPTACATAIAAGFLTVQADISQRPALQVEMMKGSPPCQTFSAAGKGSGRKALEDVYAAMDHLHVTGELQYSRFSDVRTGLVLEPLRWALEVHRAGSPYRAIVLEQVPPVLPVWQRMGKVLESIGYSVVTGNLHAEQYGVPQTRKRAVLIARLDGEAQLPTPTHSKYHNRTPERLDSGVQKWVSMAEALGRGLMSRPSPTITGGGTETGGAEPIAKLARYIGPDWVQRSNYSAPGSPGSTAAERGLGVRSLDLPSFGLTSKAFNWVYRNGNRANAAERPIDSPAPTVMFGARSNKVEWVGEETKAYRVTVQEAAMLQSLPADHPWQGNKGQQYLQVGNAIPGLLAKAILECVL